MSRTSRNRVLSPSERAHLLRNLSIMYKTGINVPVALTDQAAASEGIYRKLLIRISKGFERGNELSTLMGDHTIGMKSVEIRLIQAGESIGKLPDILEEIAEYYEQAHMTRRRLKNGIFMPACSFIAACFIAALPDLFNSGISLFLVNGLKYIIYSGVVIGIVSIFIVNLKKNASDKEAAARLWWNFPLWGEIQRKIDIYKFSSILSASISVGLGIMDSLNLAAQGVDSYIIKKNTYKARYNIEKKGMTLQHAFLATGGVDPLFMKMISSGEISGTIDSSLSKMADYTYEDIKYKIDSFIKTVSILAYTLSALFIISRILIIISGIFKPINF